MRLSEFSSLGCTPRGSCNRTLLRRVLRRSPSRAPYSPKQFSPNSIPPVPKNPVFLLVFLLARGFCRTKFWAKFPFWRGAVRGEVFCEVCREVFHEIFGLVLLGHSEQQKNFSKTSALNSHDPAQQNWRNFREKLHDEVLQGDPRQYFYHIFALLWGFLCCPILYGAKSFRSLNAKASHDLHPLSCMVELFPPVVRIQKLAMSIST